MSEVITYPKFNPEAIVPEERELSSGLDLYKVTMARLALEKAPEATVTFTLNSRGEQNLAELVAPEELQARLNERREKGWTDEELEYLESLRDGLGNPVCTAEYIDFLRNNELPPVSITIDPETNELAVSTTGNWPLVTFWETVVMGDINEIYFENLMARDGLDPAMIYNEGERRLNEKIAILKERPDIKFAEFGTRRHFSTKWQKYVIERLKAECPKNLVGTSNVGLARTLDLRPIGTYAHEMPMVYAGIAETENMAHPENERVNPLLSHQKQMTDWIEAYPGYDTALTDTFGTDFFLSQFGEVADQWHGVRHDSGDPFEFGDKFISFLEERGIDPLTKTICFSDGLDIDMVVRIADYFEGRINFNFGIGTNLTNDLGLKPLNIVMKATRVEINDCAADTVKLSDNVGKHTGNQRAIEQTLRDKADLLTVENIVREAEGYAIAAAEVVVA